MLCCWEILSFMKLSAMKAVLSNGCMNLYPYLAYLLADLGEIHCTRVLCNAVEQFWVLRNLRSESHTLWKGVNELLPIVSIFLDRVWWNSVWRESYNAVEFCKNQSSGSRTLLKVIHGLVNVLLIYKGDWYCESIRHHWTSLERKVHNLTFCIV